MAILDTLIIQLELDGSALGKGLAQARQSLIGLEQQAERTAQRASHALHTRLGQAAGNGTASFHRFRQEAMGALALFTGGRSLAGMGPEITLTNTGPDTSATQSGSLPAGIGDLHKPTPGLTPLTSLPDTPASGTQALESAGQSHPLSPADTSSPAQHSALSASGPALADWATLLHQASDTARQALQEVEPTLHNARQAMARFHQTSSHNQTDRSSGPSGQSQSGTPVSSLLDLSALLTARSILKTEHDAQRGGKAGHTQAPSHATGAEITSSRRGTGSTTHPVPNWQGQQNSTPSGTPANSTAPSHTYPPHGDRPGPAAASATHAAPGEGGKSHGNHHRPSARPGITTWPAPHPGDPRSASPQLTQLTHNLRQLSRILTSHWGTDSTTRPTSQQLTSLPPAFTRLVRQVDAATAPRHVTTHHHNTTHGPTVNVVVNGGAGSPAEIGRMARQGTAEALQRHQTGRVG